MAFQPEKVGPILLATMHKILTDHGLQPAHIELCYDGQEDPQTYSTAHHMHPTDHDAGHSFNLARALRSVAPGSENPEANGIFVRFFEDGTMVVAPAVIGISDGKISDPEHGDEQSE